jgi:hypothetical protein
MPSGSSARSDFSSQLAQGGSRRTASWNNSTDSFSSTPRPHHHESSLASSTTPSQSFTSSPPITGIISTPPHGLRSQSSRDPSPTPAASTLTSSFEKWNKDTFYRYKVEYDEAWTKWIDTRQEYKSWVNNLSRDMRNNSIRKREVKWGNTELRSSQYWIHFQEGASSRGVPLIRCVWCGHTIQHPLKNGNSGMQDHHKSRKCSQDRRRKVQNPRIADALRKQGEKVYFKFKLLRSLELSCDDANLLL